MESEPLLLTAGFVARRMRWVARTLADDSCHEKWVTIPTGRAVRTSGRLRLVIIRNRGSGTGGSLTFSRSDGTVGLGEAYLAKRGTRQGIPPRFPKKYSGVKGTVFTLGLAPWREHSPRAESTWLCGLGFFRLTPMQDFRPFREKRKGSRGG